MRTSQATRNARLGAVGNGIEVVGIKVVGNRFDPNGFRIEAVGIKVVGNRFDLNGTDMIAINVTDQNQTTQPMLMRLSQTKPLLHSQATWVAEEPDAGHRETHHAPPPTPDTHVCLHRALPPALAPSIPTRQMQTKNPCRLPTQT